MRLSLSTCRLFLVQLTYFGILIIFQHSIVAGSQETDGGVGSSTVGIVTTKNTGENGGGTGPLFVFGVVAHKLNKYAGKCGGGTRNYNTWGEEVFENTDRQVLNVYQCFDRLRRRMRVRDLAQNRQGCLHDNYGDCDCTADSTEIKWSYLQTFEEALRNMKRHSKGFRDIGMETSEGTMYVSYNCHSSQIPLKIENY